MKKSIVTALFFIAAGFCFARSDSRSYKAAVKAIEKHDYGKLEKIVQKEDFHFSSAGWSGDFAENLFLRIIERKDEIAFDIFYAKFGNLYGKTGVTFFLQARDYDKIEWLLKKITEKEVLPPSFFLSRSEVSTMEDYHLFYTRAPVEKLLSGDNNEEADVLVKMLGLFMKFGCKFDDIWVPSVCYKISGGGKFYNHYPLLLFATERHQPLEVIQFLVEHGVNINRRTEEGDYALRTAYQQGRLDIYNYLKSKGAIDF